MSNAISTNTTTRLLVSKKEAAEALGLCVRTVDHLVAAKELAVVRVGKRVLVKYASLVAFTRKDHSTSTAPAGSAEVQ